MLRINHMRHTFVVMIALVLVLSVGLPIAAAQDGGEARTLRDFIGREITLDAPPQRIVGMSASISEMLFAIGVTPVGVTAGMDYPAEAATLPTFGSGYQPDLEALAELEPDLIIANVQLNMSVLDQLEAIAPTYMMMTLVPSDIPANIRTLGQITWHDTPADYLATAYEDYLAMAGTVGELKEGPSIIIIVGTLDVPNYGKSMTYLGSMAATLGATNMADAEADAGPFPGYAQLSIEAILDADPDFILTVTRGADTPMPESMASDPVWSELTAVKEGRAIELDNRLYVEAPGPRSVDAMNQLYDLFYGEAE